MRWSDPAWITIIVAAIGAIVAFSTFLAICVQAWVYYGQLKQMEKSTNAATKAAKAAESSVVLARNNAHLDQRAWLTFANITGLPVANQPFHIRIAVKNTGKTFAKNVNITPIVEPINGQEVPDFPLRVEQVKKDTGGGAYGMVSNALIPPGGDSGVNLFGSDGPIAQEAIDGLKSGKQRVFVYGKVSYDDIFKCHHWTTFCWVLGQTKMGDWTYMTYETYNEIDDDDCPPETDESRN